MEEVTQSLQLLAYVIPLASAIAFGLGLYYFVKYKANIDAMERTAETWEENASAEKARADRYKDEIDELRHGIEECKAEVASLHRSIEIILDEFMKAFDRHGVCSKAQDNCPYFEAGDIE